MTDPAATTRPQIDVSTWSDAGSRDALALVASSVAEMVGFEIAIISAVVEDRMFSIAVEGSHQIRRAMLGVATPLEVVLPELERADDWGRFQFVPHHRVIQGDITPIGWIPDLDPLEGPDAWHPLDLLIAPLLDESGAMIGLLSIDVPTSGRRPDPTQRHLLQRYAVQAERALRLAVQRHELAERKRLAEAAHEVVRRATSQHDLDRVLQDCREPLLDGFRADFVALRAYEGNGVVVGTPPVPMPPAVRTRLRAVLRDLWRERRGLILADDLAADPLVEPGLQSDLITVMHQLRLGTELVVPIGAGLECLGHVILGRTVAEARWSADEVAGALDVARDIGQAVANIRNLAREQELVRQLQRLSAYKSQLLTTVSHELKNPLGAVVGHLEMLESEPQLGESAGRHVRALDRAAQRMARVVDDLLLLAEVEDPGTRPVAEPVDVRPIVHDAVELLRVEAVRRRLTLEVQAPADPVEACCAPVDLERVVTNLVSNALKYSPGPGRVSVDISTRDDLVEISVADEGLGISVEDQAGLFVEFFRSTNPQAIAQPGTGLGLAICARMVERNDGHIEVTSKLGVGSTFRVSLTRPDPSEG